MAVGAIGVGTEHGPEGSEGVVQPDVYFLYGCAEGLKIAGGGFGDAQDVGIDGGVAVVGGPANLEAFDAVIQACDTKSGTGALRDIGSRGSCPERTCRRMAESLTVRDMGPDWENRLAVAGPRPTLP